MLSNTDNGISYVVCAVQRSGSSFLCELLKSTGIAGVPEEYFLFHEHGQNFEAGWWAQGFGITTREEYLSLVLDKGRTENGIFGTKMMWNYFANALDAFTELPTYAGLSNFEQMAAMLGDPKYIWIVRKDKVRQAVSWAIAAQTNIYASSQGNLTDYINKLKFDYKQIKLLHQLVLEGEIGWETYFAENDIRPFKVVYEDLVAAPREMILVILKFLGVEVTYDLYVNINPIKRQATSINDEWVDSFLGMIDADSI